MEEKSLKIHILIINNDFAETKEIGTWLEKDMRIPWNMCHSLSVSDAKSNLEKADLIILKPEMEGIPSPKEVFQSVEDLVFEIPILVLTSVDDERGLTTYVMEHGAADTIIRGHFARLVDAVEFALIRQKRKTAIREASAQTLIEAQEQDIAEQERHRQIMRMLGGDYAVDQRKKTNK